MRKLLASLLFALMTIPAMGQSPQLGAGQLLGNPTAARAPATATTIGALMAQYYSCTNRGSIIMRGATDLTCLVPSSTSGLPLLSQGTGADLAYGILPLSAGGTGANLTASNGGIFYSTASAGAILSGTPTARRMLQSGASAAPAWSTATWPATTTINRLLYSSATNTVDELATVNSAILSTTSGGVPSWITTVTVANGGTNCSAASGTCLDNITGFSGTGYAKRTGAGAYSFINPIPVADGGTNCAVASGTCLDNLTGFSSTGFINRTGAGTYTFSTLIPLTGGGTNASLTASNGGIVWSNATQMQVLAGTATAGQMLRSGATATPSWSTATWPATTSINQILYSSAANVVGGITTANNGVLITSGAGVPSISSTLPSGIAATNMALTTPSLGAATATSINGNTLTTGTWTLTGGAGKTLTFNNTLTFSGTDGTTMTYPSSSANLAALDLASQTLSGGANVTQQSLSTGSITVNCGTRPLQSITGSTSAWSITAPAADGSCMLLLTNAAASAVIPTFSGFTVGSNTGSPLTATASAKFTIQVWRINGTSGYTIFAHQ